MKKIFKISGFLFMICALSLPEDSFSQNTGIGISTPAAGLHIKGSADISQLIIQANSTQGNINPLIKLKSSTGKDLIWIHSDDSTNIFIGQFTGRVNNATPGGGIFNTFVGGSAGYSNSSGYWNVAIGRYALYSNTIGFNNTAQGESALRSNTTGIHNTALGTNALWSNNTGIENTAAGASALFNNTIGRGNTALGVEALNSNTTGDNNTALGYYSLFTNSIGIDNTAIGSSALYDNTTGSYNTATGMQALWKNTTGTGNTGNGFETLSANTTGAQNTAVGSYALNNILTSSSYNTVLGDGAGSGAIYYMGWNNTLVGAHTKANAALIYNSIALGESALSSANNEARIGNSSTTSIGGYAGWSNISDGRVKKNIQYNVPGLLFINKLNATTYTLDLDAIDKMIGPATKKDRNGNIIPAMQFETDARKQKEQIVYTGFIAQDVEEAAKEINYDFSGVDAAKNGKDLYGLRYAEFAAPLVKAAQELSRQNEELLKRIEKLESLLAGKK